MREICIQVNYLKRYSFFKKEEWNSFCWKETCSSSSQWRFLSFVVISQTLRQSSALNVIKLFLNLNRKLKFSAKGVKFKNISPQFSESLGNRFVGVSSGFKENLKNINFLLGYFTNLSHVSIQKETRRRVNLNFTNNLEIINYQSQNRKWKIMISVQWEEFLNELRISFIMRKLFGFFFLQVEHFR